MARPPDETLSDALRPAPNRRSESSLPDRSTRVTRPRGWRAARAKLATWVRTAAWLVPLTCLIWIYAEREQEVLVTATKVPITVQSAVPGRFVEFAGPTQTPTVDLELDGPRDAVDGVRSKLYGQPGVVLDLGSQLDPGMGKSINVINELQNLPLFRATGVTVKKADKSELTVNVERVVEREAEVVADPRLENLATPPVFEPPRVRVRGPEPQVDALAVGPDGKLQVSTDFSKAGDLTQPGDHPPVTVPVVLPASATQVRVTPPQVRATVQVRAADVPYTIPYGVTIKLSGSADVWNNYTVQSDTSIGHLQVIGPPDQIALLQNQQGPPPTAELDVRAEDFGQEKRKTLTYDLPPGVHVTPEQAAKQYAFTLTRRDAGG